MYSIHYDYANQLKSFDLHVTIASVGNYLELSVVKIR